MSKLFSMPAHVVPSRLLHRAVLIGAALIPLWVVPATTDFFSMQKLTLWLVLVAGFIFCWSAETLWQRRVRVVVSPFVVSALAIFAATLLSAWLAPNQLWQLSGRFVVTAAFALTIIFGSSVLSWLRWSSLLVAYRVSYGVLALLSLLQLTPLQPSRALSFLLRVNFSNIPTFSLTESSLIFLGLSALMLAASVLSWKESLNAEKKFTLPWQDGTLPEKIIATITHPLITAVLAVVAGTAVLGTLWIHTDLRPVLLPFSAGWGIAIENLKSLRATIVGVGPESFLTAFHRAREVSYNMTPYWNARFAVSSSEFLHVLTTAGIFGLGAWLTFFAAIGWAVRQQRAPASLIAFLALHILWFFLLPYNVIVLASLAFATVALTNELRAGRSHGIRDLVVLLTAIHLLPHDQDTIKTSKTQAPFAMAVALLISVLAVGGAYGWYRVYAASYWYQRSLDAIQQNKVVKVYEYQQKAIAQFPVATIYHRSYAETNFAIARNLNEKSSLSDQERQTFANLLQQAIREARTAVALNPQETANWEALAGLYSNLLRVEGATQWATAAYVQAIQTDPISPALRLGLGNVYLQLDQSEQALRLFEQAIQLKPDWPNAFFQYGNGLVASGQFGLAQQAYQQALNLLPTERTQERTVVETALANAKSKADEKTEKTAPRPTTAPKGSPSPTPTPTPQALPNNNQPTQPEAPAQTETPQGFGNLLEGQVPENQNGSGNIQLPESVGF